MESLRKLEKIVVRIEDIVIFCSIVILIGDLTVQVLSRYVLPTPLAYTVELSRVALIWLVFFGAAKASYLGHHFTVYIITAQLPPTVHRVVRIFANILAALFVAALIIYGFSISYENPQIYPALNVNVAVAYVALPLGSTFMAIHMILAAIYAAIGTREKEHTERPIAVEANIEGGTT